MWPVSYFSAVIGRHGSRWRALPVDVEDVDSLDELGEHMRNACPGEGPVLAVLEREDSWFALVRVDCGSDDADDGPRAFVSDLDATERSQFAELLAPVADVDLVEYASLRTPRPATAEADDEDVEEDAEPAAVDGDEAEEVLDFEPPPLDDEPPPAWAGDPGLLADLGVSAEDLVELVVESASDPGAVLADVGERCGFDDQLDALR
jgi:putative tRNA adenosine deaminase-associated protein